MHDYVVLKVSLQIFFVGLFPVNIIIQLMNILDFLVSKRILKHGLTISQTLCIVKHEVYDHQTPFVFDFGFIIENDSVEKILYSF